MGCITIGWRLSVPDVYQPEAQVGVIPLENFSASSQTTTEPRTYVSEVVVYSGGKGQPGGTTYVTFFLDTPLAPRHDQFQRDIGALDQDRLVEPNPAPQTPLEWELEIDLYATLVAVHIAQFQAANPSIEYGAYIYVDSSGHLAYTPITSGTATDVQIQFNGINPSQVVAIVHSHPDPVNPDSNINHFPSPAVPGSDGVVRGDWAVYDYFVQQSARPDLMRTYIINQGKMWEYSGGDRDPVTEGSLTPTRLSGYRRW